VPVQSWTGKCFNVSGALQIKYDYEVTRSKSNYIYADVMRGVKSVDVGGAVDVNTEIGNALVKVSDGGFVTVESDMLTRLRVDDRHSKQLLRELEVVDMSTGGRGLAVMLRDGDEIGLGLDKSGRPLERLKVKYVSDGVELCRGDNCIEVREGQNIAIGRGNMGINSEYISKNHIEVAVERQYVAGEHRLVAWVRDMGSANGTAVYGQDGVYILYTGRADHRSPVAGIPPKSYGFRTPNEVHVSVGNIHLKLPHAAPAARPAASVKV